MKLAVILPHPHKNAKHYFCWALEFFLNHPFASLTREHRGHRGGFAAKESVLCFCGEAASVTSVFSRERSERVVKIYFTPRRVCV
jgi:hypothetical protein